MEKLIQVLIGAFDILTAGCLVYFALQVKFSYGNAAYYPVAVLFLIAGLIIAFKRG